MGRIHREEVSEAGKEPNALRSLGKGAQVPAGRGIHTWESLVKEGQQGKVPGSDT